MANDTIICHSREEWLTERQRGLGASDAAVILGLSPWKSPLQLYAEKAGLLELSDTEREELEWGHRLEPVIAKKYEDETGRSTIDPGDFTITVGSEPWLRATLDREVLSVPAMGAGVLELKNTSEFKRDEWQDEPPLIYQVQVQHQLAVTGYQWGSIAVLIGGRSFLWCDIPRNDRFIATLLEHEQAFWQRVERRLPPEPDGSASTSKALAALFPKEGTSEFITLGPDALEVDERRMKAKLAIEAAQKELEECENRLKAAIGSNIGAILPNGAIYTWKHQRRAAYTVAASEFRVLRRRPSR